MISVAKLIVASVLLAITAQAHATPDTRRVQMNGATYQVPAQYFIQSNEVLDFLRAVPGLDTDRRELLFTIPAEEVTTLLPSYVPRTEGYVDDLRLLVFALSADEVKRYSDPARFADLRDGKGTYMNRVVETDLASGLTSVYRRIEYPYSREVFRTSVLPTGLIDDPASTWLAHCLDGNSTLTSTKKLTLCRGHVLAGNIALHFTTSETNLLRVEDIRRLLVRMLGQWKAR